MFEDKKIRSYPSYIRIPAVLSMLVLIFIILSYLSDILAPLFIAGLFSLLMHPLCKKLEKMKVPREIAIALCIIIVVSIFIGILVFLSTQIISFTNDIPALSHEFYKKLDKIQFIIENDYGVSRIRQDSWIRKAGTRMLENGGKYLSNTASLTASFFLAIGLIPLYMFFLMMYRKAFKAFSLAVVPERDHHHVNHFFEDLKKLSQNYILGLLFVLIIVTVLNSIALLALEIQYAILFGFIAALFAVVPYIGIVIGGALPVTFALLTKDSLWYPLGVVLSFYVIQLLEGNVITPKVVGSKVSVNPLAAIIALLLGAKLWGGVGMVLAIPGVALVKIIFDHIPILKPYGFLLGNEIALKNADIRGLFSYRLFRILQIKKQEEMNIQE